MFFKTEKVTDRITRISGIAGELMYLAEGDREAALIDTGVGVGNLKELVHSLTEKEVFVLLSHGHVDHALGAGIFEHVYMSPLDEKVYEENSKMLHRINFLDASVPGWRDKKIKYTRRIQYESSSLQRKRRTFCRRLEQQNAGGKGSSD